MGYYDIIRYGIFITIRAEYGLIVGSKNKLFLLYPNLIPIIPQGKGRARIR